MNPTPHLAVVIPAYREGSRIHDNLRLLLTELDKLDRNYEVVVVSDGSPDQTVAEAQRVASAHIKVVEYPGNMGKGYALRRGFEASSGDPVVFIDADMELHPSSIKKFLDIMHAGDADVVVGSKRHPESRVVYPAFRRVQSMAYQSLVRLLFSLNVKDTQTGLKLFRREVLEQTVPLLVVKRFAFDLELLAVAHHLGYTKIQEGPIDLTYKFESTTNPTAVYRVLYDTAAIFYRLRLLRYYDHQRELLNRAAVTKSSRDANFDVMKS
jgi:glycosyltransferase involved in cell wall biosynthesis